MKTIILLTLVVLAAACSPVSVSYDYDRDADFDSYTTYGYAPEDEQMDVSPFFQERARRAVDREMQQRGYGKSELNPDLLVDLHVKKEEKRDATASTTFNPMGYIPWRYGFGPGFSTTNIDYQEYVEGTLFINIVDNKQERIIWQGRGSKILEENLTPEKRERNISEAIDDIFKNYPVGEE
jgi:hypothetical protein